MTIKLPEDSGDNLLEVGLHPTLDRFSAFSDGVFAIAITLLVLELPVPPPDAPLLPALREAWPDFLGYIISFAFIGGIWLTHAGLTRLMKHGDTLINAANLLLLLFVALLPFTTFLMVTHLSGPDMSAAVFLYGVNFFLASLLLTLIIRHIVHEPDLLAEDISEKNLRRVIKMRWVSIGINSVAIVMAFIMPYVAVALYLIVAVGLLIFPLVGGMHRRRKRSQQASR